eukprot:768392-Hanusia_phi.AAC.2
MNEPQRENFRVVKIRKSQRDPDSRPPLFLSGGPSRPAHGVAGNKIKTTKYNIITFLPKNLMEQFRRLFNVFWLIQCVISLIPSIAAYSAVTTIMGLAIVLVISMLKDGYEDYRRYMSDKEANLQPVYVFRDGKFEVINSENLLVGDIVRVDKNEVFPADLVMVSCSDHSGIIFIETSNLDGERNLKRMYAFEHSKSFQDESSLLHQLQGELVVELPNPYLYEFTGQWKMPHTQVQSVSNEQLLDSHPSHDLRSMFPISVENLCLRGARLKKTNWAIGIVVYAGMETKLSKNSTAART